MPLEKGTLIFANFTSKVKDTGEGIDTTREEDARKLNIFDAGRKYAPRLVAAGDGWLIAGLDEQVVKMSPGERKEIELPPEKAYGLRDPTQTRMVPLRKFGEREHELSVGDSVEIENRVGIVRFVGSGRAQVDFNHRLSGKSILYDFEVVNKVEGDQEKAKALANRRFGDEGEKVEITVKGSEVDVKVPEDLFLMDGLQIIKRGLSSDIFKYIPTVVDLTYVERFANQNAKKPEPKTSESSKAGVGEGKAEEGGEEPKAQPKAKRRKTSRRKTA